MDNASENRVVHACWCKGRMFLWIICLIAQHCFLSGHSSMDIAIETPGSGHETHSDEGKKDNSAIGRALLVTRPPTCPSPSPSFRIRCPSTSPAQTLLRASSGPCYGPDPSHYFLFAWSPPLTLALHLPSLQSLWTPFQPLVSFAGWLGLGPAPALFFVVPWILPTRLRAEVLKNRLFFQGEFSEVLSLHLPGEIHWL